MAVPRQFPFLGHPKNRIGRSLRGQHVPMPSLGRFVGFATLAAMAILLALGTLVSARAMGRRRRTQRGRRPKHGLLPFRTRVAALHRGGPRPAEGRGRGRQLPVGRDRGRRAPCTLACGRSATTSPTSTTSGLNDEQGRLRLTSFRFPTPVSNARDRDAFAAHVDADVGLFVGEPIVGKGDREGDVPDHPTHRDPTGTVPGRRPRDRGPRLFQRFLAAARPARRHARHLVARSRHGRTHLLAQRRRERRGD